MLTDAEIRAWLGSPRYDRYLSAAGPALAMALYNWNLAMAAAALRDLGHFEVALRNSYDAHLGQHYPDWAVDPASRLFRRETGHPRDRVSQRATNRISRERLDLARRGLGGAPTHGQVIANLDFGFWAAMTTHERTATFWTPMISRAYPAHARRGSVHQRIDNLRKFRNRLAHNEPVFSNRTGLAARLADVYALFDQLQPNASAWVQHHSTVPTLIDACPLPGLIAPPTRGP